MVYDVVFFYECDYKEKNTPSLKETLTESMTVLSKIEGHKAFTDWKSYR